MKKIGLFLVLVLLSGCSFFLPQGTSVSELDPSYLSCTTNPEIVDGSLDTKSILRDVPGVAQGGLGVLIKLDKPRYVKYIEVYAASKVHGARVYVAASEPYGGGKILFEPIREHHIGSSSVIGAGQVRQFQINRKVLYLKLLTEWKIDYTGGRRIGKSTALGIDKVVPTTGPAVKEIKFYVIGDALQ